MLEWGDHVSCFHTCRLSARRIFYFAILLAFSASPVSALDLRAQLDPIARAAGAHLAPPRDQSVFVVFDNAEGRWAGTMTLSTDAPAWDVPRATTRSFYVMAQAHQPGIEISERLIALAHEIARQDDGTFGIVRHPPERRPFPWTLWTMAACAWVVLAVLLRWRRISVQRNIRLPHIIPAAIQATIFTYWWIYWPGAGAQIATFPPEILLAYGVDGILAALTGKEWKIGFGPLPIVLSTNLFTAPAPLTALVIITTALGTRAFIQRNGKHVLNPSAAGLAVGLLLTVVLPHYFQAGGVFPRLTIPPNMCELILILALIPQSRFRIALATVGTACGALLAGHFAPEVHGIAMPGILIMMVLFVTDPATIPKTPVGLFAYGLFIGLGMGVISVASRLFGVGDDRLIKVLPVPFGNALVPVFDSLGAAAAQRWRLTLLQPKWNLLHIAVWWAIAVPQLLQEKPRQFDAATHWTYGTPLIVRGPDDVPRCENNPAFCHTFTFGSEISLWIDRWRHAS
jgi:hypothetical protein